MKVTVNGIGWLTDKGYGALVGNFEYLFADGETLRTTDRSALFSRGVKNYGRLDSISRMTLAAVSLALRDGGLDASPDNKKSIGIIGAAAAGSLSTDRDYFTDYLDNGRKLSRANLFIYTLPSSPLGEAAIHFGLTGPLFYLAAAENNLARAAVMAADIIAESGAGLMLAGEMRDDEAIYLLLGRDTGRSHASLDEVLPTIDDGGSVDSMVEKLKMIIRGPL